MSNVYNPASIGSDLKQLLQRITRIETRVTMIGNHVGCQMGNALDRIHTDKTGRIVLAGLDATAAAIRQYCKLAGLEGRSVDIWYAEEVIMTIRV